MSYNTPGQPRQYLGENRTLVPFVTRPRRPTIADYRQPETGKNYIYGSIWQVGPDPTTGTFGELWMLQKIVSNQGYWVMVSNGIAPGGPVLSLSDTANTLVYPTVAGNIQIEGTTGQIDVTSSPGSNKLILSLPGGGGAVDSFTVQANTAPGTNPVIPTALGAVTISGNAVAAHSVPIETRSRAANAFNVEVQYATSNATTDATKSGIAHFNSAHFSVDANGFVGLTGGGIAIDSVNVDASTAPGTDPVTPDGTGQITVTGAQVATGTIGANVIRTNSTAANTYAVEIQRTTESATTDSTKNGVSHFDSAHFDVDTNAWVQIANFVPITTWTPTLTSSVPGTITYAIRTGQYSRIGPLVICTFELSWTGIGVSSGDISITGFPVAFGGGLNRNPLGQIWTENLAYPAGSNYCVLWGGAGLTSAAIYCIKDGGIPALLQIGANATLHGTICYFASV